MEKTLKNITVLFENDSCSVLNKPSGLAVQGGEGVRVSLDSILSELITPRPFLVHRLDKDTSGVILVAKTKAAAAGFSALFSGAERRQGVVKQYLGVCFGAPRTEEGVICLDLDMPGKNHTRVSKRSETHYRLLAKGECGDVLSSLLEIELGTGRMHQIRRHFAQTGIPIMGDDKYGNFPMNKKLRKIYSLKHLLLHASRLVIPPSPGLVPEGLDITAPLPLYFSHMLEQLTLATGFPMILK